LRVLVCEDNKGDFVLLRQCFGQIEAPVFDIEWVQTLDESFEALSRHEHDVALVDYRLIGGCGLDLLREAVAIDWRGPVIMLTSLADPSIDIASMKLGAADFLNKEDIRPALLDRSIRYGLEKKRLEIASAETNRELLQYIAELRRAKDEIDAQNRRIVSLAHHLSSATSGPGQVDWAGVTTGPGNATRQADHLGIWHFDADGRTLHSNAVVRDLLETREPGDLARRPLDVLLSESSFERLGEALRTLDPQAAITLEVELVGQISGCHRWAVMSLLSSTGPDKQVYMASVVDITDRRNMENATRYLAKHDSLTQLANRASFQEHLRHATAIAKRSGTLVGLVCIDLDRFKAVNDTHGHHAGDSLLRQVGLRLQETIRDSDTAARLGGDEFAVIATNLKHHDDAAIVADKVSTALNRPFEIRGHEFSTGASVGFAVYPTQSEDLEDLFEQADAALYRVKRQRAAAPPLSAAGD
jgi:diguanylate cyclase (GGDEF)-like protein